MYCTDVSFYLIDVLALSLILTLDDITFLLIINMLGLYFQLHHTEIIKHRELLDELSLVQRESDQSWSKLDTMFSKVRCLVSYQKSAVF